VGEKNRLQPNNETVDPATRRAPRKRVTCDGCSCGGWVQWCDVRCPSTARLSSLSVASVCPPASYWRLLLWCLLADVGWSVDVFRSCRRRSGMSSQTTTSYGIAPLIARSQSGKPTTREHQQHQPTRRRKAQMRRADGSTCTMHQSLSYYRAN
jgi:hypothetical protein